MSSWSAMPNHSPQPLQEPTVYLAPQEQASFTPTEARPMFFFAHSWQDWEYFEADAKGNHIHRDEWGKVPGRGEWLPRVSKITVRKGGNGSARGEIAPVVSMMQQKGAQTWVHGDQRLGPWAKFVRIYKSPNGLQHFVPPWESAMKFPDGRVHYKSDEAKFIQFRRYVRDHVIEPMSPMVWEREQAIRSQELERIRSLTRGATSPAYELEARIFAAMQAAWERESARGEARAQQLEVLEAEFEQADMPEAPAPTSAPASQQPELTPAELAAQAARKRR